MKAKFLGLSMLAFLATASLKAQQPAEANAPGNEARVRSDAEADAKAAEWVSALRLGEASKEARLKQVISFHLKYIRDWNNSHAYTMVPAGINPATGEKLSELHRQIIVNSSMPANIHADLMSGLRRDLTEQQVEAVLDKYTIGKVDFTMKGYKAIVPDLKPAEEAFILKNLKLAREQAVDFKSMKQISAIFEIYKTKCEQYLNANGRNWHQMFKDYVNKRKAEKAAEAKSAPAKK